MPRSLHCILLALISITYLTQVALALPAAEPLPQTVLLQGTVTDASGASVANAQVSLEDEHSRAIAHTATDSTGHYSVQVAPNTYRETIAAPGFDIVVFQNLQISADGLIRNVSLKIGDATQTVTVTAESTLGNGQIATSAQSGILGNMNIYETPFSTAAYTDQLIRDQQALAVSDVLANDPSVRLAFGRGSEADLLQVRGFLVSPGYSLLNGISGLVDYREPGIEGIEKVELFKGPSTLMNGTTASAAAGGTVNLVTKRAGETPLIRLTGGFISAGMADGHADLCRRFGPSTPSGKPFGMRINAGGRVGSTPIDNQEEHFGDVTAALDYRSERLHASIDANILTRSLLAALSGYYLAPGIDVPVPPRASSNIFDHSESYVKHDSMALAQADYAFSPKSILAASYGHLRTTETYIGPYSPTILNTAGDVSFYNIPYFGHVNTGSARLTWRTSLRTGPINHQITLAGDATRDDQSYFYEFLDSYNSNIYHPIALAPIVNRVVPDTSTPRTGLAQRTSFAAADVMNLFQGKLQFITGLRPQQIRVSNYDRTSGAVTSSYNKGKTSPSFAALYRLTPRLSIYSNYVEDLQQGPSAPTGTANSGQNLAPVSAKQVEAGAKYDLGRVGATFSLYRITQPNGIINRTTNIFAVIGQQRNRGVELNLFGNIRPSLCLVSGIAMIEATQTATGDPTTEGKRVPGVSVAQVTVSGEWTPPVRKAFTLTARTLVTSKQYIDSINTQSIPGWGRLDMGGRYTVEGKLPVTLRVNVNNVTGKNYWESAFGYGLLSEGAPRTILASGSIRF